MGDNDLSALIRHFAARVCQELTTAPPTSWELRVCELTHALMETIALQADDDALAATSPVVPDTDPFNLD